MNDAIKARLAGMRAMFLGTVGARLAEAEELLRASGPLDAKATHDVHHVLHQLRGNAGMFGCYELGKALHPLLTLSENVDWEGRGFRADEVREMKTGVAAARAAVIRDDAAQLASRATSSDSHSP